MSWNTESTTDEKGVKLVAEAAAWLIEFTLTPPTGMTIGCYAYHLSSTTSGGNAQVYSYKYKDGDKEKRYTNDEPFYNSITQSDCDFLDESHTYNLAVSYSIFENGEEIETNRVISVNIATVSRAESGSSTIPAPLNIESVTAFPDRGTCDFSICIDFLNYIGGTVTIDLALSGRSGTITLDKSAMTYIEYNDPSKQIKLRYYMASIDAEDVGYGHVTANVTVRYTPNAEPLITYGMGQGHIQFAFTTLSDGSPFKIKASEWNELVSIVQDALSTQDISQSIQTATRYTSLTVNHINSVCQPINLCIGNGVIEADYFRFYSNITFGKRPSSAESGFELFSRLEACANKLLD